MKDYNTTGTVLFIVGCCLTVLSFFVGLLVSGSGIFALYLWIAGAVFGMLLIGISEIIQLLHRLVNAQRKGEGAVTDGERSTEESSV
ncbi:hypothetical protein [Paenibacillus gansuensis]|uniref:Uncharacterized protein n=1 Tax=Paenibacillus gansuensis TaxID=306542 RepID=A0ABW5PMJ0_9BACL